MHGPRETRAVARNTVLLLLSSGIDALSSLGVAMVAARYLGPEGFGEFAFIRVYGLMASPLIAWGTWSVLIRDAARDRDQAGALLMAGLTLNLVGAVLVMAASLAGVSLLGFVSPEWRPDFLVGLGSQAILAFEGSLAAIFVAENRVMAQTVAIAAGRILQVALCLAVALAGLPHVMLFWAQVAASAVAVLLAVAYCHRRIVRLPLTLDIPRIRGLFRESFSVGMATLLTLGYTFVAVFVLNWAHSMVQLALFQAGQRLITSLMTAIRSFMTAAAPAMARLAGPGGDPEAFRRLVATFIKYILVLTVPVGFFLAAKAEPVLTLLYGPLYGDGAPALMVIAWMPPLLFLNRLLETALISMGKQRTLVYGNVLALVLGGAVGLAAIPRLGAVGASMAYLASGLGICLANGVFARAAFAPGRTLRAALGPVLCAGVVLGLPGLFLPHLHPLWYAPLGGLYLAALWRLGILGREELRFLADLVRKRGPRPPLEQAVPATRAEGEP
uniref:Membrane protein involved in the export of O-antigen and teichoic acid n=1 Tax=Desulfovibrio sp. U5L TaxID=596152 RepID=I2Q5B9_9BACT